MRVLLDTHAFLWFVLGDSQLSSHARNHIDDLSNEKLVSPASYWEIAIKISLNKYTLSQPYEAFMQKGIADNGFIILPIEPKHTAALTSLPFHHRDPFDRLIIAQAMVERIPVISGDEAFAAYPVTRIW
jgi:PIN domain nuclease of toxin-antitoxin system